MFRSRGCVIMDHPAKPDPQAVALKEMQDKAAADSRKKLQEELDRFKQSQQQQCRRCEQELNIILEHLEREIKQQLITMSIRIAEIILARELPDAGSLQNILSEVLSPISDLQGVRIRMAPGSMNLLGASGRSYEKDKIDFIEDASLQPGDVVVESRNGIFDGRLRSRLDHLAEVLAQPTAPSSS